MTHGLKTAGIGTAAFVPISQSGVSFLDIQITSYNETCQHLPLLASIDAGIQAFAVNHKLLSFSVTYNDNTAFAGMSGLGNGTQGVFSAYFPYSPVPSSSPLGVVVAITNCVLIDNRRADQYAQFGTFTASFIAAYSDGSTSPAVWSTE